MPQPQPSRRLLDIQPRQTPNMCRTHAPAGHAARGSRRSRIGYPKSAGPNDRHARCWHGRKMNETRAERSHGFHWRNDKSRSTETTHASAAFELIGCQGGGNTTAASTVCRQVDEVLSQRHAQGAAASSARGDVGTMVGLIVVSPMPEDLFLSHGSRAHSGCARKKHCS